jgi:hypothetical protein
MHQTIMSAPGTAHGTDPALDHSELERIAMAALEVGRLLMETGARAEIVHEDFSRVHSNGARELRRAQAIFGLFELTAPHLNDPAKIAMTTMEFTLRVIFTIGAIGAGLSIATHIFRSEVHD